MADSPESAPGSPGSHETLRRYLEEIGKIPLLSRDEEISLARQARNGDAEAFRKLVESNLRFVVTVAKKYSARRLSLVDLINEGNIGLMEAARRFDPERGVKFISYAVWWIRQAIVQALADQGRIVRLPLKQAGLLYKINLKWNELRLELQREPTLEEVAQVLELSTSRLEKLLMASRQSLSLESPLSEEEDHNLMARLKSPEGTETIEEEMLQQARQGFVSQLFQHLNERERYILEMRFGFNGQQPLSLEKIGKKMGLTRERIRQIEKKAKSRLQRLASQKRLQDFLN